MFNKFITENGSVIISDIQYDYDLKNEYVTISLELNNLDGWILSKRFEPEILETTNQFWADEFDRNAIDLFLS